jgi:long-chain acyl-CoA synthetase
VVMERFDPLELLAAIERHRVTHVQLVPTHMIRLLKLSEEDRARFDLSSLQLVVHASAPCPVEVKAQVLDWLGPIVHEFYSGSEGAGFTYIGPEDWLAHPGSVGRSIMGDIHIVGDDGEELPVGEEGQVWFSTNRTFEYYGDPEKTKGVWDPRGWSWLGDVGRVDDEGYLFLTDRASNMIISGGVNIYPREVEDALVVHPEVTDVAVIGTPDPDMGEKVTAFVLLEPDARVTADELITWCRDRLSHFKCPREVRFVDALPRLPTGKLLKRLLVTPPSA